MAWNRFDLRRWKPQTSIFSQNEPLPLDTALVVRVDAAHVQQK